MIDYAAARTSMVDCQIRPSDVTRYPIIAAMLAVPRESYVPNDYRTVAYSEGDIPLGEGRVMLAPRTLAKMIDALELTGEELVLDLGAGLGYSAAVLARNAQTVIALEEDESLRNEATKSLQANGVDNALVEAGALAEGAAMHAPFDAIVVEGAFESMPDAIADQLREDGRIVALRVDGPMTYAVLGVKGASGISWRRIFDASATVLPGFAKERGFEF